VTSTAGAGPLDRYLAAHRPRVEAALGRAVDDMRDALPPDVVAAVRHGVTSGGKRLRPILCLAAFEACGGRVGAAAYDLAASLELIHAYSLMHDDLPCMDDAELRRGSATTHVEHGEDATVLAGVALIPAAARQALVASRALGLKEREARRIAGLLMAAAGAGGMVGGQWLDLLGEGRRLGPEQLMTLHRHKTGALLTASLTMGAAAAGARGSEADAMEEYGARIGLAFQIADDVLDATRSADELGKNPSDAELDKSTYVALFGVDGARARARAEVEAGVAALEAAGVASPPLVALAAYVVERRR